MHKFVIEGGRPLVGSVTPSGNKNEALPCLFACLLTDEPVTLERVPRIGDVLTVCEILRGIGVEVDWSSASSVTLCAAKAKSYKPRPDLCSKVRASILLLGPLLARFGKVELPLPGGDVIGARRIDTHWHGIEALGAHLDLKSTITGALSDGKGLKGCEIFMDEPSVTATENLLLLAARAEGTTVLHHAACEPHVVGLCNLLIAMGVNITGVGTNRLTIVGSSSIHGARHRIGPDFMEVGSFLCLGAIGGGRIEIQDVKIDDLRFPLKVLARLGIEPEIHPTSLIIDGSKTLHIAKDIGAESGPFIAVRGLLTPQI